MTVRGNKIVAPVHALWGAKGTVGPWWDVLATWRAKATSTVTGRSLDCAHFQQEERPDETLEELWRFNVGTALKGAPVTYSIGTKQYLAVQTSGRHLHPVKFDNFQDSSYLFVFALN